MGDGLLLSVRFHDGRYHGSGGWPPAPARLFQALVAGAARGGRLPDEARAALAWLETLPPPAIAAPAARAGRGFTTYVPNNDLDAVGGDPGRVGEIKASKTIRPWLFDAGLAVDYLWRFAPDATASRLAAAVCALADDLCRLGRGVDQAWARAAVTDAEAATGALAAGGRAVHRPVGPGDGRPFDCPMPGSLASLETRHAAGRMRFASTGGNRRAQWLFTQAPKARFAAVAYDSPPRRLLFELRAGDGGDAFQPWPLAAAVALCERVRDRAADRLAHALPAQAALVRRLLVGRDAGPADIAGRIRIAPLPSIGHEHADQAIRRLMVEVPAGCPLGPDDVAWACAGLALDDADPATGEVLRDGALLTRTDDAGPPAHYGVGAAPATVWRSVTPLALPVPGRAGTGHIGGGDRAGHEIRAAAAVARALRHAGIAARPVAIRVQREPFGRRGRPADAFAAGPRFAPGRLWHVEITFDTGLAGPLILGDGRYLGLGVMAPCRDAGHDVVALALPPDAAIVRADAAALLHAARRALMALARDDAGGVPPMISGHAPDGAKAQSGRHEHIFLAADGGRRIHRLVVAAPWAADRTVAATPGQRALFDRVVAGLRRLRAGRLGVLALGPARALGPADPLAAPARVWETRTPYRPPRHPRGGGDMAKAVARIVQAECAARGLPRPEVEVLELAAGRRGGHVEARLRLRFAVPVAGPLMLGRDSHRGGGLFAAARP